ncbi:uncharacterized protein LOC124652519 isoform X2 [Lolium rigidum]|uniref:uncharacterized protein LOC124652519 isoform X2 n=1 Tax=Lolium rigidum TaxID=89674 RepID=UPI001F5DD7A9|nr:uncharacterized protein LOC124652519 isoform X2 [Lolium rigidum]
MKSGVGSALGGCASTVKQADIGSQGTFSVALRKKRGRTAPPSSRCLRGKKDDKVMDSDDAINNLNHACNVQATAVKNTTAVDKTAQAILDDVYKAEMNSTSSDNESAEEVEDVKVCDICGDVGDEEKLAVCNRCNDGAEHIYCMQVMMEKVPEVEWFCEECQAEVDFGKDKLQKSQVKVGISKQESIEEKINKPVNAAQGRSSSENEVDAETVGRKEWNEANQAIDTVTRRNEEDARIMTVAKQNIPEPGVLLMGSDSRKRIPLSRDSSFRLVMEKGKQPTPQVPTLLASSAAKSQAPPFAGQLSKSTSFNTSKVPKVKQLVNEAPQKTKTLKAQLTSSMKKEGPMCLSTKPSSFKKPKTCESAIKAKTSIIPPAEELTVINLPVSRNASNDRGTSILGCPSIAGSIAFPVQSKAESAAERLTTGNNTATFSNLGVANEQGAGNVPGNSELNKPLLAKAPVSVTSTSSPRSLGILGSGSQRNVFQNSEASHWDDKINYPPSLRLDASSSSRVVHRQRCNEAGHSTQFCGADTLRLSAIKPPSERNLKDVPAKRNVTSEANSLVATENTSRLGDQAISAVGRRSVHSSSTMSSDLMDKLSQAFLPGDKTIVSTVPELDYIWQGDFELWRTGRSPELCDGFQAHLSCTASRKVLEVAKKFPSRVQLEELPRQDSWPMQFQENGPTHENIGVFFFARDAHSYEHHYSKLVQNMLNNDLALRGNIETAELLIFPSNILSNNSQRWNMFYFLWGVFRVTKKDHDGAEPDCNSFSSATCADHQYIQASEANIQGCSNGENSSGQPLGGTDLEDYCHDSIRTCCLTDSRGSINDVSAALARKRKIHAYPDSQKKMSDSSCCYADEPNVYVNTMPVTCSISSIHEQDNRSRVINFNNTESLMDIYHFNSVELNSGAVNPVSHASGGAQKRKVDMLNWTDGVNGSLDKKIKLDNVSSTVESSVSENIRDGYPLAALSVDDCTDNKAMPGTSKSNGKCIFPLDLNAVDDDATTGNVVTILSSDDEDLPEQNTQGLKLELGDNGFSGKSIFSFSPMVEEKWNKGESLPTDTSGVLSLATAFPASKEQAGKMQSESCNGL